MNHKKVDSLLRSLTATVVILLCCVLQLPGQVQPNRTTTGGGGGGGSTAPGGSDKQFQFNDVGSFAGTSNLTWTKATKTLAGDSAQISFKDPAGALSERYGNGATAAAGSATSLGNATRADAPRSTIGGQASSSPTGGNGDVTVWGYNVGGKVRGTYVGSSIVPGSTAGFPEQALVGYAIVGNAASADAAVVGASSTVSASDVSGVGHGMTLTGTNGSGLGSGVSVTHNHATVIGQGAASTAPSQVTLGTSADSVHAQRLYAAADISAGTTVTGATGVNNQFGSVQPYKVYTALVADSGVVAVLQNTLGGAVTFGGGGGSYTFDRSAAFTAKKTFVTFTCAAPDIASGPTSAIVHVNSTTQIDIETIDVDFVGMGMTNQQISNANPCYLEIRVYP